MKLGLNIVERRKQKMVTQSELAKYLGVTKASISKWETGQASPDITYLPRLATYFNCTIDELMGYSPQLSKLEIKEIYRQYTTCFAEQGYEKTMEKIEDLVNKYYSCFPFLYQMGVLLLNYSLQAPSNEWVEYLQKRTEEYFKRVIEESDDWYLVNQTKTTMATLCFIKQQPEQILENVESLVKPALHVEYLVANAYAMQQRVEEANQLLRFTMYQGINMLGENLLLYASFHSGDSKVFEECMLRLEHLIQSFNMETIAQNLCLKVYYLAATVWLSYGKKEKTYEMLDAYLRTVKKMEFPLNLQGDEFFVEMKSSFEEMQMNDYAPRDTKSIKISLYETIANNEGFQTISKEKRYQYLVKELKEALV